VEDDGYRTFWSNYASAQGEVANLVKLCNAEKLEIEHLRDVVENYIYNSDKIIEF